MLFVVPAKNIMFLLLRLRGFLGETFSCGLALTDENGNFRKVSQMHHMTIYGIFIIHGLIDILMSCHVPLPRGLDYLSAAVCFIWLDIPHNYSTFISVTFIRGK